MLFIVSFLIFLLAAYYLVFRLDFVSVDVVPHIAYLYFSLFNNQPSLTPILFAWPPLPTFLLLPLVLNKALATTTFAANLLSCLFGALSCVYLNKLFRFCAVERAISLSFTFLFGASSLIFFYAVNGSSEVLSVFLLLASLYYTIRWIKLGENADLFTIGFPYMFLVFTLYEAAGFILLLLVIIYFFLKSQKRKGILEIQADLIIMITPLLWGAILWIFLNWMITGDPFYFMLSSYRESSFLISGTGVLSVSGRATLRVPEDLFWSIGIFPLSMVLSLLLAVVSFRKRELFPLGIALSSAALPLFLALVLHALRSSATMGFFISAIPLSFIMIGLFLAEFRYRSDLFRVTLSAALLIAVVLSSLYTLYFIHVAPFAEQERGVLSSVMEGKKAGIPPLEDQEEVAAYLIKNNLLTSPSRILLDDRTGFYIILRTGEPEAFVDSLDRGFGESVNYPVGRVDYIIVPRPVGGGEQDNINIRHPNLFYRGELFSDRPYQIRLVKDFEEWRIYFLI